MLNNGQNRTSVFERVADSQPPYSKLSFPVPGDSADPTVNFNGLFRDEIIMHESVPARLEVRFYNPDTRTQERFFAEFHEVERRNILHFWDGTEFKPFVHVGIPQAAKDLLETHLDEIDNVLNAKTDEGLIDPDIKDQLLVLVSMSARKPTPQDLSTKTSRLPSLQLEL